jgi:hypothetical protein
MQIWCSNVQPKIAQKPVGDPEENGQAPEEEDATGKMLGAWDAAPEICKFGS